MAFTIFRALPLAALILNILLAILVVFLEKRNPGKTWAWLMVMLFIPYVGFFLYWIFGFDSRKYAVFARKRVLDEKTDREIKEMGNPGLSFSTAAGDDLAMLDVQPSMHDLAQLNFASSGAVLTKNNSLTLYYEGGEKFAAFLEDIKNAKDFIHMLYYVIRADSFGKEVVAALADCARRGVEVKFIVDGSGLSKPPRSLFKPLIAAGGQVAYFAPPSITRINFRNHRKIAVIDGVIGYIGGLNIGDEYLGRKKRFGFWRDTHMRLEGDAVKSIETRFIMDWNYKATIRKQYGQLISPSKRYLPHTQRDGRGAVMQIVSSGPDTEWSSVYFGYAKMITEANKNIYIQSPYFVPDENIFESLRIAALSGIDVRIVIPGKPDHPFVYWAALSYMGELLKAGVKCYTYQKGFLHTKVIMIDGAVSTVGTANMDVRSFKLNLEINAFIFDRKVTGELEAQFMKDLENSRQITQEEYDNRPKRTRIKESFSRLLSPLL